MIQYFTVTASNAPSNPASAQTLLARSTSASDTQNLTLTGATSAPVNVTETRALTGKREVSFATNTLATLTGAKVASAAAGAVTVYEQGTAGTGDVRVDTVPTSATTLTLGLTGFTQVYTFRDPARFTIATVAASSVTQGSYVDVLYSATTKRFWFDKDAAGTGAPSDPGGGLFSVGILSADTNAQVATKLNTSLVTNLTQYVTSISTNVVTATRIVLGTGSAANGVSSPTFTITAVAAGTADAANQVRTGYHTDGVVITTSQVASNISFAVNASGGTAGTHYGTGTAANTYLSASVGTTTVTLTDRLAIVRELAWAHAQSASHLTIRSITSAVTGTLLCTIAAAGTQAFGAMNFNNPALASTALIANTAPTTDALFIGGRPTSIHLIAEDVSSAVTAKVQASDDALTYYDVATGLSLDNNDQRVNLTAILCEYVKVVVTANANTTDSKIHMAAISA